MTKNEKEIKEGPFQRGYRIGASLGGQYFRGYNPYTSYADGKENHIKFREGWAEGAEKFKGF